MVQVAGFVPDLVPVLESMHVAVAPLPYGVGVKSTVAIAMGAGSTCVFTSIAAAGMGIPDGKDAFVVAEPVPFGDAVVSLHTRSAVWNQLSRAGQIMVRDRFGEAANRTSLLKALNAARILRHRLPGVHYPER